MLEQRSKFEQDVTSYSNNSLSEPQGDITEFIHLTNKVKTLFIHLTQIVIELRAEYCRIVLINHLICCILLK